MRADGPAVTYATAAPDDEARHAAFEAALPAARAALGKRHGLFLRGAERSGAAVGEARSPIDRDLVIGEFAVADADQVDAAVQAAADYAPEWAATPWEGRVALLRRAADALSGQRYLLAATMAFEVGKDRLEGLAEVEESAAFLRYYCDEVERHQGFRTPMDRLSPDEVTLDVLLPYGVWAVVSPFNFPLALAAGPVAAALLTGNTVVLKPAGAAALSALQLAGILEAAGLPPGALQVVTGPGGTTGKALVDHPLVAGITFTGSATVGREIALSSATRPSRPILCEMGGKNPVVVGSGADLEAAVAGSLRSAFGFGGQKCSAASRAYVLRGLYDEFTARVAAGAAALQVGDPRARETFLGPLIDEAAIARYEEAIAAAAAGRVLTGGQRLTAGALARGNYVAPAIVEVPPGSWVWHRELFAPILAVAPVDSVDEGVARANDTEYGLTAGFYGSDPDETARFLGRIRAGVVYVNRRAGATTGAWPGVQPFGGWQASGSSGKGTGGPWALPQYLREQSRTIVAA